MQTSTRALQRIYSFLSLVAVPLLLLALLVAGCGTNSGSGSSGSGQNTGSAFVIGTDAPVASVASFNATIQSLDAIDAGGKSVSLVSGTPTVDFARYNGLQTLLDMNNVPADTYTQISVTFSSATIGYLQMESGAPPAIQTMNASFTSPTATVTLANPLVVSQTGPVGVRLDFRLDKSLQTSGGQITGEVTPTLDIEAVGPDDPGAFIDEFDAAVVNVDASSQTFTVQGPHGRQWTINVNGNTEWDGGATLSDLSSASIVQISGVLDKADFTIDADEVAILSQNGFYAAGLVTYVQPASGAASDFDMYVRGTLPASGTGVTDGIEAQVDLSGQEQFSIYWMHNPFAHFLFNPSTLLAGQHVAVGGSASGAGNAQALSVNRVVLRHSGLNGTFVPGSIDLGNGTFQIQVNGFAGILIPQTVTVYCGPGTSFRFGLTGVGDINSNTDLRVVGLLIKDPTTGQPDLLARYVDILE
jgi:hypothetical protein